MVLHTKATQGAGDGGHQSAFRSMARQGSVYSLAVEEVQSHLGEPLHSMNLDELVRNVVQDGETGQFFLADGGGSTDGGHSFHPSGGGDGSIAIPRSLSKKTVGEMFRGIQVEERQNAAGDGEQRQERRTTLGEMTLENFLEKAGVAGEGTTQNGHWWQQQQQQQAQEGGLSSYVGRPVSHPLGATRGGATGAILDGVYRHEGQGPNPSSSPAGGARPMSDPQTTGRKRWTLEGMAEKTVERRQKRMIKNRESAARSRARKQAYTNELENKISRLEEENERLRNENKELETVIHCAPRPEPKNQLRRTSSASF